MKNNCGKRQKLEDGTKTEMQTDKGSCDINLAFFGGGGMCFINYIFFLKA